MAAPSARELPPAVRWSAFGRSGPSSAEVNPKPPTAATAGSWSAASSGVRASPAGQAVVSVSSTNSPLTRRMAMLRADAYPRRVDVRSTSGTLPPIGARSGDSGARASAWEALGSLAAITTSVPSGALARKEASSRARRSGSSEATTTTLQAVVAGSSRRDGTAEAAPYRTSPSSSMLGGAAGPTLVRWPWSTTRQPAASIWALRVSARSQSRRARASVRSRTRWVISGGGPAGGILVTHRRIAAWRRSYPEPLFGPLGG